LSVRCGVGVGWVWGGWDLGGWDLGGWDLRIWGPDRRVDSGGVGGEAVASPPVILTG
jgi:hypothetical protein